MANKQTPITRPFLDANGDPYSGAQLFVYTAGSATKVTVYQDVDGNTAHANPIVLNSRGEIANGSGATKLIWQAEGTALDFKLAPSTDTDPPVAVIDTLEDVSGINDTSVTIDQWVSGNTPTYVGATSFTLVGDQTSDFHVGRRVKTTNSGGTIYSTIITSAYTSLTTITVVNDSGSLDAGLSAVSYGLLSATNNSVPDSVYLDNLEGADVASATTTDIWSGYGRSKHVTGTTTITSLGTASNAGDYRWIIFDGILTLTHGANLNIQGGSNVTTAAGDMARVYADTTTQLDVTYFRVSGVPMGAPTAAQGSSMVWLDTQTASNSTDLQFTDIPTTDSKIVFMFDAVLPATDTTNLQMRVSTDNGATFISTGVYTYMVDGRGTEATAVATQASSATSIHLIGDTTGLGNGSTEGADGELTLCNPSSTTLKKRFYGLFTGSIDDTNEVTVKVGGSFETAATDVDAVQFLMAAGNITSGSIRMYGIKDA